MTDTALTKRVPGEKKMQAMAKESFFDRHMNLKYAILVFGSVIFFWSANAVEFDLLKLWTNRAMLLEFIIGLFPPDMTIAQQVFEQVVVTIQLAFVGTVIATIVSLPLGFLAAENVMPSNKLGRTIVGVTRFLLNADRAIDAVILALFFAGAVGLYLSNFSFQISLVLSVYSYNDLWLSEIAKLGNSYMLSKLW
jgi:ABC-type phosphate/phosphonate transport system permease subunit